MFNVDVQWSACSEEPPSCLVRIHGHPDLLRTAGAVEFLVRRGSTLPQIGPSRYCTPRHPTHFTQSVIKSDNIFGRGEQYLGRRVIQRISNRRVVYSVEHLRTWREVSATGVNENKHSTTLNLLHLLRTYVRAFNRK